MPDMREEDVLAERIMFVWDSLEERVLEIMWNRVYENEWRIYREDYAAGYRATREEVPPTRYQTCFWMDTNQKIAEAFYESLLKLMPKSLDFETLTVCIDSMDGRDVALPLKIDSEGDRWPREEQLKVRAIIEKALKEAGYNTRGIPVI